MEMINFYKIKATQKYQDKSDDEQYEHTGMKINKHFLIVGKTGAGKSNCLINYLYLTSQGRGTFDHVFFCYVTNETLYDYLKDTLKKKVTFIQGIENFPDVSQFPDVAGQENPKKYLVVMDDVVNEANKKNIKKIEDYFKVGRKRNITVAFLSQRYYDTSKFIRANVSYTLIASMGPKDAVAITKDSGADVPKEILMKIYKYATTKQSDDDLPFLKITNIEVPLEKKFSRNFTAYINPADFM